MPVSFFSLLLLLPLSMHASAARIFTTRIRKKILCNIKLASGHLPIRVVRNFTSVMTVMRILEKAFEKFFPYPAILRQTYENSKGEYIRIYRFDVSLSSTQVMWNFRSTFYIIETIPLIIHVALTSCLCVVRIFDGNINRNIHNRKTHVHSQFYAYQSTHSLILHFSSRASMHYHATLSEWARIEIIE